jgi:hypothetical protein
LCKLGEVGGEIGDRHAVVGYGWYVIETADGRRYTQMD